MDLWRDHLYEGEQIRLNWPCLFNLEANKEAPDADFEIEHVYGYRAADCQQNL